MTSPSSLPGRFVVFEGGEGAGKSTLIGLVAPRLRDAGREVVTVREPGGTEAGELVRALLHLPLTPWAEAFAFLAARAQVVAEVIRPALERGATVLCDRFAASTFAYQGFARGLDLGVLRAANTAATGGLEPGLTVWLDLDPAVGLARKHGEAEAIRTGLEAIDFHRRVRAGYAALMAEAPEGAWLRLDATRPTGGLAEETMRAITGLRP
ncbi:MAG: dTMP kinase [Gemmatimonadales bacterium]